MSSGMNGTTSRGVFKSIAKAQAADLRDGVVVWISGGRSYDIKSTTVNADFVLSNGNGAFIRVSETIAASSEIEWDFEWVANNKDLIVTKGEVTRNAFNQTVLDFSRASTTGSENKSGVVDTLAADEPSIVRGGLEIYGETVNKQSKSRNLATSNNSISINSAGTGSLPSVTENYATAPNMNNEATRVVLGLNGGSSTGDSSNVVMNYSANVGGPDAYSIYIKSNSTSEYQIRVDFSGLSPDIGSDIITAKPEWQRFYFTFNNVDTSSRRLNIRLRGGQGTSDSADILIWQGQAESGSVMSPPIFTDTVQASRGPDIPTFPAMKNLPAPGQPFTIEIDCTVDLNSGANALIHSSTDTVSESLFVYLTSDGRLRFGLSNGVSKSFLDSTGVGVGDHRFTLVYDSESRFNYIDGDFSISDNFGKSSYDVLSIISVGHRFTGDLFFNNSIKSVRILQKALTVDQIAARGGYNA